MNKGLKALNDMLEYLLTYDEFNEKRHKHNAEIIETELKNKHYLECEIGEMLVDYSKGNYADVAVFINELREVLEKYEK